MDSNISNISIQQTEIQKKSQNQPQIQRESAGPQLTGLGQKKEKEKQQQQQQQNQSQSLSQQLESNLGEQITKQNDSVNESLDQSEEEMNQFFQALSSIKPVKIVKTKEELAENNEQETILETEIYSKVLALANHGYSLLASKENLTEAIVELRRAENVISTYLFSEGSVQQSLVLFTLSNLAIAYYRIGFLEESLVCLENCLVSLKNQAEFTTLPSSTESPKEKTSSQFLSQQSYFKQLPGRLSCKRLRCNFHMQCCIILSEMRRHEDALIHSRLAARLAFKIIIDSMIMGLGVFICLFFDGNSNAELESEMGESEAMNEEQISNNENSQALRRSKKTYEESNLEDLAITSNKNLQENEENLQSCIENNNNIHEQMQSNLHYDQQTQQQQSQLQQQQQQQQQQNNTRVESFSAFMQVWKQLELAELKQLFENLNTTEFRNYLLQLIPILLELNTRISGSANHYDMAISPYKGEIILNTLSKKALNLNSQNIDLSSNDVFQKPVIESIFKGVATDLPLFNSSILALLQLQPLAIEEFAKKPTLSDELSPEFILKKISYFAITLYCSSTETRFLEDQHMLSYLSPYQLLDSEILLGKSLEIVFTFLKPEMIFVSQILAIYQRFHGQTLQSIPEDLELNEKYLVLKPLNGRPQKFRN